MMRKKSEKRRKKQEGHEVFFFPFLLVLFFFLLFFTAAVMVQKAKPKSNQAPKAKTPKINKVPTELRDIKNKEKRQEVFLLHLILNVFRDPHVLIYILDFPQARGGEEEGKSC